ncbi:transposase [Burkholderia ubonensis]|nr:transposase [Burkholderia ubonensis]KVT96626.1 transposase [Burkholderia ubonensis]KWN69257.1 transposase [Burkholderia ubonensis]ONB63560.1 transposase [Burkholderia pseudomallei]ONC04186.1 transposase [Burkholderia pseudomallei]
MSSRYVPKPAPWLGKIVTDIPPVVHALGKATCRTPDELLASRARFGYPAYAIEDAEDSATWYFSNDLQEAVALGLKWVEKDCALIQIPEDQDGEVVYAYVARGLEDDPDLEYLLYRPGFWRAAGGDLNEAATPEIMTRLRIELFRLLARLGGQFILLDFSNPASVTRYLENWENDLEA